MELQGIELSSEMIWTSLLFALFVCVLIGIHAWRTLDAPPSLLARWAAHARKRDGKGFVFGVGVLLTAMGAGLLSFFMGFVPSKGAAVFIALLPVVFSWLVILDIWRFRQSEHSNNKGER